MCLSMSAACVIKARLVSSRTYNDHDVNCNYMQDVSERCLCIPISLNLNYNNTSISNQYWYVIINYLSSTGTGTT
jgi:hypothetical protein